LNEKRADYVPNVFSGNVWIAALQENRKAYDPPVISTKLCSFHLIEAKASFFPLLLRPVVVDAFAATNPKAIGPHVANLSDAGLVYLNTVGGIARHPDLFFHTVAVLHAPKYAAENADALRQDWPRVPLPNSGDRLAASGALGRQLAALLDPEAPVPGVTQGKVRPELKPIAVISKADGTQLDPNKDCEVNAR